MQGQENSHHGLAGTRVLLGVCGGIAAYKSPSLVRRLREAGAQVRVVMTDAATRFVGAAALQAVSGQPVRVSLWDDQAEAAMGHIELARWADAVVIAPVTAATLSRLAQGLAEDLLSTLVLASDAPLWLAPAMNRVMWTHPAVQANVATLAARGARVLGPDSGEQACGDTGPGRLQAPEVIVAALCASRARPLAGRRVVVSAGPTQEALDPVRFLGNRSSGRMGFAIAAAAVERGAEVVLVAGPVALPTPPGVQRIDVRSAEQMHAAVLAQAQHADAYIGAAAVADYRPRSVAPGKIKKSAATLTLELERTPDILADLGMRSPRPYLVGFAAETDDLERHARAKLERKHLDLIAANRVGEDLGFERADNALLLLGPDFRLDLGAGDKADLARRLLDVVAERLPPRGSS